MCSSRRGIRPGILVLTSVMTVDRQDILEVERRPGPIRWWFTPCTLKLRLTRADRRSWLLGKLPFNINLRSPDLCSHPSPGVPSTATNVRGHGPLSLTFASLASNVGHSFLHPPDVPR
jgi:hypothetical protein